MLRLLGVRNALLTGLVTVGLTSTAFAQTSAPASGLGQSWPNAADVSANPHWHVYVFVLNGIKYVQVNDLNGTVRAAVGTAGGSTIVLPVGVDAQRVSTDQPATAPSAQTVYNDGSTTVTATPQTDGTTTFNAATTSICNTYNCGGGRGG